MISRARVHAGTRKGAADQGPLRSTRANCWCTAWSFRRIIAGNLCLRKTAWWGREDSNCVPSTQSVELPRRGTEQAALLFNGDADALFLTLPMA
jgi:hypothetical protein